LKVATKFCHTEKCSDKVPEFPEVLKIVVKSSIGEVERGGKTDGCGKV
jgi:hypothetical protein